MKLYDGIIEKTMAALPEEVKEYAASELRPWPVTEKSELVMLRDAAFELGGSGNPSVNYTCVTTGALPGGRIPASTDRILVAGPDLDKIRRDVPFARITLLRTKDLGEEDAAYQAIREMEFARYHIYPRGYMVRVSTTSFKEQVRVSRKAAAAGISFGRIGADYIREYRKIPGVLEACVIFITEEKAVKALEPNARKVDEITKTLSHILDGLDLDCSHCGMKSVCDEVEGLREEHMKRMGGNRHG